jgi:type II secretory pathway pseudopilin PulG
LELIVVIGILAIVSSIGIAVMDPMTQFKKANDARIKADFSQIQKALEQFYEDNGRYPSARNFKIVDSENNEVEWNSDWQPYMNIVPKSPYSSGNYVYYSPLNGQAYYLYANLERSVDPDLCNAGLACSNIGQPDFPGHSACGSGKICNYGVSSQNVSP